MSEQRNPRSEAELVPAVARMRDACGKVTVNAALAHIAAYPDVDIATFIIASHQGIPPAIALIGRLQVQLMDAQAEIERLNVELKNRETFRSMFDLLYEAADHRDEHPEGQLKRLIASAAAYDTLRAACDGVPDVLYEASIQMEERMGSDQWRPVIEARAKAAAIRAALDNESD